MTPSLVAVLGLTCVGFMACSHPGGGGVFTGSAGNVGTTGSGGDGSPAGTAGTSGSAGISGGAGTSGSAGDVGTTGTAGAGGNSSPTGTAGTVGTPGDAGTSGAAGNGVAGTTGTAGTAGSAGASGSAGTTGTGGSGSGNNLIANGDFSGGATNWHTEMGTGNVNGGAYCVSNPGAALIGWDAPAGSPLMLMGGKSYRISYEASGAGSMHLKIGMAAQPYGDIYTADDALNSSLQTFTHNFTPTATNNAGLAFTFSNAGTGMVCLDNVTLTAN
jgi:hypothetical protein